MTTIRNALVTGTGGDLGAAIAARLRDDGYHVVGLDRIAAESSACRTYVCDLADIAALRATLDEIRREIGLVQVLVNNAAYYNPVSFWDLSPEQIQRTMAVNVTAILYACQQIAGQMREAGGGVIVNMASIAGRNGSSQIDYGASKAAVINMTTTMGRVLAQHNIRVNAIAPALVDSGMGKALPPAIKEKFLSSTPLKRAADPREIANVVAFLISEEASYMTGTTIDVHGGL